VHFSPELGLNKREDLIFRVLQRAKQQNGVAMNIAPFFWHFNQGAIKENYGCNNQFWKSRNVQLYLVGAYVWLYSLFLIACNVVSTSVSAGCPGSRH
jgi:hypothetical protein